MRARGFRPAVAARPLRADQHRRGAVDDARRVAGVVDVVDPLDVGMRSIATASKPPISPICTNDGFSAPSDCMSVAGRMCSSRASSVRPLTSLTGTTDRANRPSSQAAAARFWLSTA